jgi:hypothetical protein
LRHVRRRPGWPALVFAAAALAQAAPAPAPAAPAGRPAFDGKRALASVRAQVAFGPRVPGTSGHAACLEHLTASLRRFTDQVEIQTFAEEHPAFPKKLVMSNVIARFETGRFPDPRDRVVLMAHWDTRPWCDESKDPAERAMPVPGANDGASGVAVLLELARLLGGSAPPVGVDIVLVDGEDLGTEAYPRGYCMGSRHYAASVSASPPLCAIVLDMVGDADLSIPVEPFSRANAAWLIEEIWAAAVRARTGGVFDRAEGPEVFDDHVSMAAVGIPSVDLIDFDYPHWHTPRDTPDKVSAESLAAVGKTIVELLFGGRLR